MSKIGFTATRSGLTVSQLFHWNRLLLPTDEVHGGCCRGGDDELINIAKQRGCRTVGHPPINRSQIGNLRLYDDLLEPDEYIVRNHDIVNSVSLMYAAPKEYDEQMRGSGTWATIRYSRRVLKPLIIAWPEGEMTFANGSLEFWEARVGKRP